MKVIQVDIDPGTRSVSGVIMYTDLIRGHGFSYTVVPVTPHERKIYLSGGGTEDVEGMIPKLNAILGFTPRVIEELD